MSSSWFSRETKRSWMERIFINILRAGAVPRHVAFIMDGNRRYASSRGLARIDGHIKGFEKLTETLEWCNDLGIQEVTVYAFSRENFKRSKEEVDDLLQLATEKFKQLLEERDKLKEKGLRIRIFGELTTLPDDLQQLIAKINQITAQHSKLFLNIALAYTSRYEIAHAGSVLLERARTGEVTVDDIDEKMLESCLYTSDCFPLDLLIRTSGEVRLSDFLLWQAGRTILLFQDVYWPDYTIWSLFKAIFYYQCQIKQRNYYLETPKAPLTIKSEAN